MAPAYVDRAPVAVYAGDFWWLAYQALDAGGDQPGADDALRRGARWINSALSHVLDEFREQLCQSQRCEPRTPYCGAPAPAFLMVAQLRSAM